MEEWELIQSNNWKAEYEKEEEFFEWVSNMQRKLAILIFDFLNKSCATFLIIPSYKQIYCDTYIDFTYYALSKGEEYFTKCLNDIGFCLNESIKFKEIK